MEGIYLIAGLLFIFVAVGLIAYYTVPDEEEIREFIDGLPKGHLQNKKSKTMEENGFIKMIYPLIAMIGCKASKSKFFTKIADKLQNNIAAAGYPYGFTPYEYIGFTVVVGLIVSMIGIFFSYSISNSISFTFAVIAFLIGVIFPLMVLGSEADARKLIIYKDLPYKLDLLTMAVEAGLDFFSAVRRMIEKDTTGSPLIEEFFQFVQEVRMGRTKKEALQNMVKRTDLEALNSIVSAIIQAESMGTPIAKVLKVQSESMRISRTQKAEKAAGEAAVKIIFPLIFILMSTMLVLFGGIVVKWMKGELF
jgi:tight adherence protein C